MAPMAVVVDITVSLDGYVTARDAGPGQGLGVDGMKLHTWVFDQRTDADTAVLDRAVERTGAVVMGRNTFDVVDAPDGWSEDLGYGGPRAPQAAPPVFVVTHHPPERWRLGERFRFCDGVEAAVAAASEAAGDKDVYVMGGGDICRQTVVAGLADELILHLRAGHPRQRHAPVRRRRVERARPRAGRRGRHTRRDPPHLPAPDLGAT